MDAAGAVIIDTATPVDAAAIGALHARSFLATYPTVPPISEQTERAVWGRRVRGEGDDTVLVIARDPKGGDLVAHRLLALAEEHSQTTESEQ